MTETDSCENCGWFGNRTDPITGANLISEYSGNTLCSSCRVDRKLANGAYND